MMRWSGYADLVFAESAWLAFARAAELADTDVHEEHSEAWVIDDRHLTFALEHESGRPHVDALERFLGLLTMQAESGEAVIEIAAPSERWVRRAAPPSISDEVSVELEDRGPSSRTIRAGSPS